MDQITHAIKLLCNNEVVAFPTETVYGLGANGLSDQAVKKIYALKGRPNYNPLIFHVSSIDMALNYGHIPPRYLPLLEHFWPGPLTIVVGQQSFSKVSTAATAGLKTIALRCPKHPIAHSIIEGCNLPIVAPSANKSMYISPTRAEHVRKAFGKSVFVVDDEGQTPTFGLESTILDLTVDSPAILRPGSITQQQLEAVLQEPILLGNHAKTIKAPGQLKKHYSPLTPIKLNVREVASHCLLLDFGRQFDATQGLRYLDLSPTQSVAEAACNLYHYLRVLDEAAQHLKAAAILVAPIPKKDEGYAINERLTRAAAHE